MLEQSHRTIMPSFNNNNNNSNSSSSLLEDSFSLLESATDLEEARQSEEASSKYLQACYLMKRYLNVHLEDENNNTRTLLQQKIHQYQKRAESLMRKRRSTRSCHTSTASAVTVAAAVSQTKCDSYTSHQQQQFEEIPLVMAVAIVDNNNNDNQSMVPVAEQRDDNATTASSPSNDDDDKVLVHARQARASLARALLFDESGQCHKAKAQYVQAADQYLQSIKLATNGDEQQSKRTTSYYYNEIEEWKKQIGGVLDRLEQLKGSSRRQ